MLRLHFLGLIFLVFAVSLAEEGFYTTDPLTGTINFFSLTEQKTTPIFNTYIAYPSAITILDTHSILFANSPPTTVPWIASNSLDGAKQNVLIANAPDNTFASSKITSLISGDNEKFFYLFSSVPNDATYSTFPLIASSSSLQDPTETNTVLSYSTDGYYHSLPPTSMTVDRLKQLLYFTTNGETSSNTSQITSGGIYSISYNGDNLQRVTNIPELNFGTFISSLQFAESSFFYILTNSTSFIATVYEYSLSTNETFIIFTGNDTVNPVQIRVSYDGDYTLWIRDTIGTIYSCDPFDCNQIQDRGTLSMGSMVTDFDISSSDVIKVFYVSTSSPTVQSVLLQDSTQESVVTFGVTRNSPIWVDSSAATIYYAYSNIIYSVSTDGNNWDAAYSDLCGTIETMSGDSASRSLLVSYSSDGCLGIYNININSNELPAQIVDQDVACFTVNRQKLYYAVLNNEGNSTIYETQIRRNEEKTLVSDIIGNVISIAVGTGTDNTLYYGTKTAIYKYIPNENRSESVFNAVPNIRPYAVEYIKDLNSLLILSEDIETSTINLINCSLSNCNSHTNLVSQEITTAFKPGDNAWITYDSVNRIVYWSATPLQGDINQYSFEDDTNSIFIQTNLTLTGLSFSNDVLYASHYNGIALFSNSDNSTCKVSTTSSATNSPVGYVSVYDENLYWANLYSGRVYGCKSECVGCDMSNLLDDIDINERLSCSRLQFITVSNTTVYSQHNCGGIVQINQGSNPVIIKDSDGDPISCLTMTENYLIWSLPFRYALMNGNFDVSDAQADNFEIFYMGTGDFNGLAVDDSSNPAIFYWINTAAGALMQSISNQYSILTDQVITSVSFVPNESESPSSSNSVSPSISVTISQSVSNSQSNSNSFSPSTSLSSSPSNSISLSRTSSISISSSPSSGNVVSPAASVSMSSSLSSLVSPTPAASVSISSSLSSSVSPSASETFSVDTSPNTPSSSVTTSISMTQSPGTPSVSNTPGIANIGNYTNSPLIGKTGWEWIGLLAFLLVACCILPISLFCWKRGIESEMALSLRLPDED